MSAMLKVLVELILLSVALRGDRGEREYRQRLLTPIQSGCAALLTSSSTLQSSWNRRSTSAPGLGRLRDRLLEPY